MGAGGRMSMVVFMVFAVVAAIQLQGSKAQRTHVVGDALGWLVPPGGAVAYSTWAAAQNFTVGDVLVFNFTAGAHDVAEVTAASFNACNTTSPLSISTTSPTNITLRSAGSHYFICTFSRHCGLGQQLAINVSTASTTPPAAAPQPATPPPSTPTPVSAPAPAPSRTPATYIVGDGLGWNVPAGGNNIAYRTWAANYTFMVGDTLVFNFVNQTHNVAEVSRTAYDSCNTTTTISLIATSPARITLATPGEHFYTCTFPRHCSLGQQLAINVTGATGATPPSTSTTPSAPSPTGETPPPPPSSSAPHFTVAAAVPATLLAMAVAFLY